MYVCMYVCMYKGWATSGRCTATITDLLCFPFFKINPLVIPHFEWNVGLYKDKLTFSFCLCRMTLFLCFPPNHHTWNVNDVISESESSNQICGTRNKLTYNQLKGVTSEGLALFAIIWGTYPTLAQKYVCMLMFIHPVLLMLQWLMIGIVQCVALHCRGIVSGKWVT
jgi:hypothetical protein